MFMSLDDCLSDVYMSLDDCLSDVFMSLDDCSSGTELRSNGSCVPCKVGTYRKQGVQAVCVRCLPEVTTPSTGAETIAECTLGERVINHKALLLQLCYNQ